MSRLLDRERLLKAMTVHIRTPWGCSNLGADQVIGKLDIGAFTEVECSIRHGTISNTHASLMKSATLKVTTPHTDFEYWLMLKMVILSFATDVAIYLANNPEEYHG